MNVPFYKPSLPDYKLVEADFRKAYESGMLAPGRYTERFKQAVEDYLGVKHAVPFSNCSDAMMCLVGYIGRMTQKRRVIIPNFTFASTWQAVDWNGMTAVLVDTDERGLIDLDSLESALFETGDDVACILAVHMFGEPAHVEDLEELALQYGTTVIYDSAHGMGSLYNDKPLGGWGMAEVFSLGTTKPLAAGEGGLLTTNDDQLAEAMHRAAMHGHKYGELDVEVRSLNGRIQEINSIIAYHGLYLLESVTRKRNEAAEYYHKQLHQFAPYVRCLIPREGVRSTYKDYTIAITDGFKVSREVAVRRLAEQGIPTKRYYYPTIENLHLAVVEGGVGFMETPVTLYNSSQLAIQCLSIPFFADITREQQDIVVSTIDKALE